MKLGIVLDEVFLEHDNPSGHPERPERIQALMDALALYRPAILRAAPVPIEERWLRAVHTSEYVERIRATAGQARRSLDADTHAGAKSYEVACLAAGSAVHLLELIREGRIEAGLSLARPPGHHATPSRAMGFCLFNHPAIAAEWAIQQGFAHRVAIVDFDVHHGNGTQEIFWTRSDVLYVSSHQHPLYPGTGSFSETGAGDGTGFTRNFPIPAGQDDAFFVQLYRDLVLPILREFKPDLIVVSAGYDTHVRDPLAGMKMTGDGFGALTVLLMRVAHELCGGRMLFVLEGGYDLEGLSEGVVATVDALVGAQDFQDLVGRSTSKEFERYARQVRYLVNDFH